MDNRTPLKISNRIDASMINFAPRRQRSLRFLLNFYFLLGIVGTFGGLLYAAFEHFEIELTRGVTQGLLISVGSVFLSVLSRTLIISLDERRNFSRSDEYIAVIHMQLVEEWSLFEENARLYLGMENDHRRPLPIREAINIMRSDNILSLMESDAIQEALQVRNMIVHKADRADLSLESVSYLLDRMQNINRKLSHIEARMRRNVPAP